MALIDSSPFWSSFFSQLLATFIVVLIGSVMIPPILRWTQRAKMVFFRTGTRRGKNFEFTQSKDGLWKSILHISVKNLGKKTVERFYWEMYVEKDVVVELVAKSPYPNKFSNRQIGDKYIRLYGYVEMPIFPLDDIDFPFEVRLDTEKKKKVNIYYYFRTDSGDSPVWSWIAVSFGKKHWLKSLSIN